MPTSAPYPHVNYRPVEPRFWSFVNKEGSTPAHRPELGACWEWTGSLKNGYGRISVEGREIYAHRYAWERDHGEALGDRCALHHCDNTKCVRSAHLFAGTRMMNNRDAAAKGRNVMQTRPELVRGESNPSAKLTTEQVRNIKRMLLSGSSMASLALEFGVTAGAIAHIKTGRQWRHVDAFA